MAQRRGTLSEMAAGEYGCLRFFIPQFEREEERMGLPVDEPQTIQIHFVSPDGVVRDGPLFIFGVPGPCGAGRRRRWPPDRSKAA
jgi:hypothetical protein